MLKDYAAKRRFEKTPEPEHDPFVSRTGPLRFVIQKHAARRLHYDLRLECDGVLKSWAVPKGPSLNPKDKRMAVMVEDHPTSYAAFEGIIPQGEYGAGEVIVWDEGVYSPDEDGIVNFDDRETSEKRVREGIKVGKLSISMRGQKVQGSFALVRTKRGKGDEWLLIKHNDAFAADRDILEQDQSVVSGRTIEEVRAGRQAAKVWHSDRDWSHRNRAAARADVERDAQALKGAKQAKAPIILLPMVPTEADKPFSGAAWSFELKLDGVRLIAIKDGKSVRLISRNGKDVTGRLPSLRNEIADIRVESFVLDGELVQFDADGRPSFQGLMERFSQLNAQEIRDADAKTRLDYVVFDLLHFGEWDLRGCKWEDRRALLERFDPRTNCIRILDTFREDGELLYEQAQKMGIEGVVGKRISSMYRDGTRTKEWVKIKGYHSDEFLICGWTAGQRGRSGSFGSLVLGRLEDGEMKFYGCVGGGFSDDQLTELRAKLEPMKTAKCPFPKKPQMLQKGVVWVEPKLMAEVRFMTKTRDGLLRFPVFVRLRPDLAIPDTMESAGLTDSAGEASSVLEALQEQKKELKVTVEGHQIKFSNLDKVLWPATDKSPAFTKRDLLIYYSQVSDHLLAHLKDRPLSLVRFPEGIAGESFFQKHLEKGVPDYVDGVEIWSSHNERSRKWALCQNLSTLLWYGQMGALELHSWYSRITNQPDAPTLPINFSESEETLEKSALNYPDFMVFDLDPNIKKPGVDFDKDAYQMTAEVALELKGMLDLLGLRAFLKTSGKTGLHVYLPLKRIYNYQQVRAMAGAIGQHLLKQDPKRVTMTWQVAKRPEKVFFDHNQNVRGKTLASIYSPRPAPGAPVSFPITWDELPDVDPREFDMRTAPRYLAERGDIWADILRDRQVLASTS